VAVRVLAGGAAADGCRGTCWYMGRKWQERYLLVDGPQVAGEVLAGKWAAVKKFLLADVGLTGSGQMGLLAWGGGDN
jgi:hypothetical protein